MSSTTRTQYCGGRLAKVTQWLDAPAGDSLTYVEGTHTWFLPELDDAEISEQQADTLIKEWGTTVRPRIGAFKHSYGITAPVVFAATEDPNVFAPVGWDGTDPELLDGVLGVDAIGPGQAVRRLLLPEE